MLHTRTFRLGLLLVLAFLGNNVFAQVQTFEWQGVQREYLIRTPQQNEKLTMPVMYFLHGWTDNIVRLDNEYHFQQYADVFGWTIIVPQALDEGSGTMWNAGLYASNTDDSGFLMALLDSLAEPYQLNLDSVFFTGFSMGGFMTHRMAIEHGDRIAACAPVSGLITFSMSSHTPVAPVRMLHIHGTADPVVGYSGSSQYFGTLGLGVEAILDYWKNANGCEGEPVIDSFPDLHNDGLRFVRYTYDCGTELQHIKVIGGVHNFYLNANQTDISYMNVIHDFFVGKGGYESVEEPSETGNLRIAPNPNDGQFNIEVGTATTIQVRDMLGRLVAVEEVPAGPTRLDLRHLSEGMYILKADEGTVAKMLIRK